MSAAPPPADVREAWVDGTIRGALLTSASTVRELAAQLGPPPTSTLLVGIGPTTAAEAARLGLPLAGVATEQTMTGLVDALATAATTVAARTDPQPRGALMTDRRIRPRRLRATPALRRLTAETRLHASQLVLPVFVKEGLTEPRPIALDARRRTSTPATRCARRSPRPPAPGWAA